MQMPINERMDKQAWYSHAMEQYAALKKEKYPVIGHNVDDP